jgi:hypothetical protein
MEAAARASLQEVGIRGQEGQDGQEDEEEDQEDQEGHEDQEEGRRTREPGMGSEPPAVCGTPG